MMGIEKRQMTGTWWLLQSYRGAFEPRSRVQVAGEAARAPEGSRSDSFAVFLYQIH